MENLNHAVFLWMNAPEVPNKLLLNIAIFFAEYAIGLIPALIAIGWLWGREQTRKVLLEATAAGLAGLLINQMIGLLWFHPRPFMMGLGHTFLTHAPESSFPSDHLTLLWAVAFSFLMYRTSRFAGMTLALLGLPMAWARIYLGVHFPLDMVGAVLVAAVSAWLARSELRWYLPTTYKLAMRLHSLLFNSLIVRGWVHK
jgi:undecaprenyl-diphosphatase